MIRLHRGPAPAIFSKRRCVDERARLEREAEDCLQRGEPVPKFDFDSNLYGCKGTSTEQGVKQTLRTLQHEKCCYCEGRITPTGYGAIEHYRPKSTWRQRPQDPNAPHGYYWLAYEWENLLLSCDVCNTTYKGVLFPLANPGQRALDHHAAPDPRGVRCGDELPTLINPYTEDPEESVRFRGASAVHRNPRGRITIQRLGLNRRPLVQAREDACARLKLLCMIARRQLRVGEGSIARDLHEHLSEACSPQAEYSSAARSYIDWHYPDVYAYLDIP